MGITVSRRQKCISDEIDKRTREESRRECKVIVLGSRGSGASAVIKQMNSIDLTGYSKEELMGYKRMVYGNLAVSIKALVKVIRTLNLEPIDTINKARYSSLKYRLLFEVRVVWATCKSSVFRQIQLNSTRS